MVAMGVEQVAMGLRVVTTHLYTSPAAVGVESKSPLLSGAR